MATQDYAASVQGVAIRVTRLDASGNLLTEPGDSYTTSAFLRASFTPEYEEGDEIVEKVSRRYSLRFLQSPRHSKAHHNGTRNLRTRPRTNSTTIRWFVLRKNFGTFASPKISSILPNI